MIFKNGSYIPIDPDDLISLTFTYDVSLYGCYENTNCEVSKSLKIFEITKIKVLWVPNP